MSNNLRNQNTIIRNHSTLAPFNIFWNHKQYKTQGNTEIRYNTQADSNNRQRDRSNTRKYKNKTNMDTNKTQIKTNRNKSKCAERHFDKLAALVEPKWLLLKEAEALIKLNYSFWKIPQTKLNQKAQSCA